MQVREAAIGGVPGHDDREFTHGGYPRSSHVAYFTTCFLCDSTVRVRGEGQGITVHCCLAEKHRAPPPPIPTMSRAFSSMISSVSLALSSRTLRTSCGQVVGIGVCFHGSSTCTLRPTRAKSLAFALPALPSEPTVRDDERVCCASRARKNWLNVTLGQLNSADIVVEQYREQHL